MRMLAFRWQECVLCTSGHKSCQKDTLVVGGENTVLALVGGKCEEGHHANDPCWSVCCVLVLAAELRGGESAY